MVEKAHILSKSRNSDVVALYFIPVYELAFLLTAIDRTKVPGLSATATRVQMDELDNKIVRITASRALLTCTGDLVRLLDIWSGSWDISLCQGRPQHICEHRRDVTPGGVIPNVVSQRHVTVPSHIPWSRDTVFTLCVYGGHKRRHKNAGRTNPSRYLASSIRRQRQI